MSEEKMRTEFEDYFSDYGECPKAIERGSSGAYSLLEVCIAWPAWQAATASKQREIDELKSGAASRIAEADKWYREYKAEQEKVLELSAQVEVMREAALEARPFVERAITSAVNENFGRCNDIAHKYLDVRDRLDSATSISKPSALLAHDNEVAAKALFSAADDLSVSGIDADCKVEIWLCRRAEERRNRK